VVGLGTASAGAQSGTVTLGFASDGSTTDGNGTTPLPSQTVQVEGDVFREATASVGSLPANLIVHVGDTALVSAKDIGRNGLERLEATVAPSPRGRRGKTAMSNASSVQLAASASTTSSCSAKPTCAEFSDPTRTITTVCELTSP
jgi:hypothetical protein